MPTPLAGRIVYQVKQLSESLTGRVELEHLSENSFGSLLPARGYFYLKTLGDFLFAGVLLPLALPAMVVASLAILADDGGPVFFRQRRLGHAGRIFTAYKFRTKRSIQDSDDWDDDDIRKSLATESSHHPGRQGSAQIPGRGATADHQHLARQMSWIGPRPEPEILTRWFVKEVAYYRYRHVVKPGISGWAQVNLGYVGGVDGINTKLQYDFSYIKYFFALARPSCCGRSRRC